MVLIVKPVDPYGGIAIALLQTHGFKVVQADVACVIIEQVIVQRQVHLSVLELLFRRSHDGRVWKEFGKSFAKNCKMRCLLEIGIA